MISFKKYQAAGNDFIIYDKTKANQTLEDNLSDLAKSICDRHYGVGADGLLVVEKSTIGDVLMRYYNSDGSVAFMCGNGIRCLAKYIYEHRIVNNKILNIETLAGVIKVELIINNEKIEEIKVNLGKPEKLFKDDNNMLQLRDIVVLNKTFKGTVINIGVMHTVILIANFNRDDALLYGPLIEEYFNHKTNVNFVEILNQNTIKVITWEKGAGLTRACGTGAAASAAICYELNKVKPMLKVIMPGGEVRVDFEDKDVYLFGSAKKICEGIYFNEEGMN